MPGIAVARELLRRDPEARVLFVGADRGVETTVVPREGFDLITLPVGGFKRTGWAARVRNGVRLLRSLAGSLGILRRFRPDVVVGLGGYASVPVVAAAWAWGTPRVLMEQNVVPGLANWLLGKRAMAVAVPHEQAAGHFPGRAVVTGNPVRPEFKSMAPKEHAAPFTVLVTGGSQGADSINRAVVAALDRIVSALEGGAGAIRFVHQTGRKGEDAVRAGYREAGIEAEVAGFFDAFDARYRDADLIVCRAGATTIAEVRAAGRAAILVPLPFAADDHQRKNARAMVADGAAAMIDPADLSGETLADEIVSLLTDAPRLRSIEENARRGSVLDAEVRIADLIEEAAGRPAAGSDAGVGAGGASR